MSLIGLIFYSFGVITRSTDTDDNVSTLTPVIVEELHSPVLEYRIGVFQNFIEIHIPSSQIVSVLTTIMTQSSTRHNKEHQEDDIQQQEDTESPVSSE